MKFDTVEAYLAALAHELRRQGVSTMRMLEEARGHLVDAVEHGVQRGLDEKSAQRQAIDQFGSAESVASTFIAQTYGLIDRLVWLAATIIGVAIAYVNSRLTWDDSGFIAFSLIAASALCGFAAPRRPWRWALAIGIWISVFSMLGPASPDVVVVLVVVMCTLAGAYAGTAVRLALLRSAPHPHTYQIFRDTAEIDPEVAAAVADPDMRLVPFLTRLAPAALAPLGQAQAITRLDNHTASSKGRKFEVVFGDANKVLCRLEISRGGRAVSLHWSRARD